MLTISFSFKAFSLEISQWVYEDLKQIKCDKANFAEAAHFNCNRSSALRSNIDDLDQAIESATFSVLAQDQVDALECSQAKLNVLLKSKERQSQLSEQTCKQLPLLVNAMAWKEKSEKQKKSYEVQNDPTVFRINDSDYQKNLKIIAGFESSSQEFQKQMRVFVQNDVLLQYPSVLGLIADLNKESWWKAEVSPKNPAAYKKKIEKICEQLKNKLPELLKSERQKSDTKVTALKEFIKSPEGILNRPIKHYLWTQNGLKVLKKKFGSNSVLDKSTYCRMEGRYGAGYDDLNRLTMIAMFGLQAHVAIARGLLTDIASEGLLLARFGLAGAAMVEVGTGVAIGALNTAQVCHAKDIMSLTASTCKMLPESEIDRLLSSTANWEECSRAMISTAVAGAFGGLGALKAIRGLVQAKSTAIIDEAIQDSNEVYKAAGVSERVADLYKSTSSRLGKLSSSLKSLWKPDVKSGPVALPSSIRSKFPELRLYREVEMDAGQPMIRYSLKNKLGQEVGELDGFMATQDTLSIGYFRVFDQYQNAGIARYMYEQLLRDLPEAVEISTGTLSSTNEKIFRQGIQAGLSVEEAIMKTPAYKIRARLGYSEIVPDKIDLQTGRFVARRPTADPKFSSVGHVDIELNSKVENLLDPPP